MKNLILGFIIGGIVMGGAAWFFEKEGIPFSTGMKQSVNSGYESAKEKISELSGNRNFIEELSGLTAKTAAAPQEKKEVDSVNEALENMQKEEAAKIQEPPETHVPEEKENSEYVQSQWSDSINRMMDIN